MGRFKFDRMFIDLVIVQENYTSIDELKATLQLETVDHALVSAANAEPAQEKDDISFSFRPISIAIDTDHRSSNDYVYIEGKPYLPGNPLPVSNPSETSAYQKAYNIYQQENTSPLCSLISRVNTKLALNVRQKENDVTIPNRYLLKPEAKTTRIFKTIGGKPYYIAIESDINIQDSRNEDKPQVNNLAFDVITIYEITSNELVFDSMLVPEGCAAILSPYLQDPLSGVRRGVELDSEHATYSTKLEELKSKKSFSALQDKQKIALIAALEDKEIEDDKLGFYIQAIEKSLQIDANSTVADYVAIAKDILAINANDSENKHGQLLDEINEQTIALNQKKSSDSISNYDILQYLTLIKKVQVSGNNIYIGARTELPAVMSGFLNSILSDRQKNILALFEALDAEQTVTAEISPVLKLLKKIDIENLPDEEIAILSKVATESIRIQGLQSSANDEDITIYTGLKEKVQAQVNNAPQLPAAMQEYIDFLSKQKTIREHRLASIAQGASVHKQEFIKNDIAEKIIKSTAESSSDLLESITFKQVNLGTLNVIAIDSKGWAEHRGKNDTYILSGDVSGFKHYAPDQNLPAGNYSANFVGGLANALKPLIQRQGKETSVSANFTRIYNEKTGYLYIVERDMAFIGENNFRASLPCDVIHVFKKTINDKWEPEGTYAPKAKVADINNLILDPKSVSATMLLPETLESSADIAQRSISESIDNLIKNLLEKSKDIPLLLNLAHALSLLKFTNLDNEDDDLLTEVYAQSVDVLKEPTREKLQKYLELIEEVNERSNLKMSFDHNALTYCMLGIFFVATIILLVIAFVLPPVGIFATIATYCFYASAGTGLAATTSAAAIVSEKRIWSPLYDAMQNVKTAAEKASDVPIITNKQENNNKNK